MISVLVVNLNNLELTKNCIGDLMMQDVEFDLTIVDQNSKEIGTEEFLYSDFIKHPIKSVNIIRNNYNKELNHIWNEFVENCQNEFVCLLNNDVRICPNFLSSALEVFSLEKSVGFVNHVTNNSNFNTFNNQLNYIIINDPYRQGWDPIFRKDCFHKIPEELKFFYGDDYIYHKLYSTGMKGAYVINSPIVHFCKQTTEEKGGNRTFITDKDEYKKIGLFDEKLDFVRELSKLKPEFDVDEFCQTVRYYNLFRNL